MWLVVSELWFPESFFIFHIFHIFPKQGRIHGYPSRVRVGRGHNWVHQTIWAGAVRSKKKNIIGKVKCDRPTNQPTDKAGCTVACMRLKSGSWLPYAHTYENIGLTYMKKITNRKKNQYQRQKLNCNWRVRTLSNRIHFRTVIGWSTKARRKMRVGNIILCWPIKSNVLRNSMNEN